MVIEGATLSAFAMEMSREFTVPVVDMTGLEGRFDFAFNPQKYVQELRTSMMASRERIEEAEARVLLMQNLLSGDLGLRLESRKAPVEMLVIDQAERRRWKISRRRTTRGACPRGGRGSTAWRGNRSSRRPRISRVRPGARWQSAR